MPRKPFSYQTGRRKTSTEPSSKVRVYERRDLPGLFMTMAWDVVPGTGRRREVKLPDWMGRPEAKALAEKIAAERRLEILTGKVAAARTAPATLNDVFARYFESAAAQDWSRQHAEDHRRSRDFWIGHFGRSFQAAQLTTAAVEKVARAARIRAKYSTRWEKRKLSNLRAAIRWAHEKARMLDKNPLLGLSMPEYSPETDELLYTEAETRKLWTPDPRVDWRVTLAVNVVVDTGRRVTAVLALRTTDVVVEGERVALRFAAETDKKRRSAIRPVSIETTGLLVRAMEESEVLESGLLFPTGRLGYQEARTRPWTKGAAIAGLHRAEEILGVERVRGRAFHGLKRRHITTAMEVSHGDASLVGDQTGNASRELVERVYRKASRRRLTGHVESVRSAIERPENPPEHTREDTRDVDPETEAL